MCHKFKIIFNLGQLTCIFYLNKLKFLSALHYVHFISVINNLYLLAKPNILKNARFLGQLSLILTPLNFIKIFFTKWRSKRDSNSRTGNPIYFLSREAPSPTWVLLHSCLYIISQITNFLKSFYFIFILRLIDKL